MKRCVFRQIKGEDGYTQFMSDKYGKTKDTANELRYLAFRDTGEPKHFTKIKSIRQRATKFISMEVKNPKKRKVKRNIRRRRRKHEFLSQEKNKHKKRQGNKVCLLYLRCVRKKWKLKRRGQTIIVRCSKVHRQNYCKCKCAKQ